MSRGGSKSESSGASTLGEMWQRLAKVRIRHVITALAVFASYTIFMHDVGVRDQAHETAVTLQSPFDMRIKSLEAKSDGVVLEKVFFMVADVSPEPGKVDLLFKKNDPDTRIPEVIGSATAQAEDGPAAYWSAWIREDLLSLVVWAQDRFDWSNHERRTDFYERVVRPGVVQRYYRDGWILEYRVNEQGNTEANSLKWVRRR